MKPRSLVVTFLLAAPSLAAAQLPTARIDAVFSTFQRTNGPGCAVGVYQKGQVAYARGYGMADLNQGVAITPQTRFYIASTSKQFAAASLTLLEMQGKVSLDDKVRKYIPELPAYADAITLRHLMHHVSGIRDYLGMWAYSGRSSADQIHEDEALDLIARQKALDFAPGSKWSYSNSGYFLISQVVKRASGLSLREFARVNMFEPLGMADTHFHDDNRMIVPRRAEGYEPDGAGGFRIVRTSFALVGDGGLYSTIEDLARWDANFYANRLANGDPGLVQRLTTRAVLASGDTTTYASGLMITTHRGLPAVSHGGAFIGYRAELIRFPGEHTSVAVLCNDYTAAAEALAKRVADVVLETRFPSTTDAVNTGAASERRPVPATALARYPGRYELLPGIVATIERVDAGLQVTMMGQTLPLVMRNDSTLEATGLPTALIFRRLANGRTGIVAPGLGLDVPALPLGPVPTLTAMQRTALVGRYHSEELRANYVVKEAGDTLMIRPGYNDWVPMVPMAVDAFAVGGAKVTITRDTSGRVTGMRMDAGRMRNIGIVRVR